MLNAYGLNKNQLMKVKDSQVIVEADKPVPRVATIGFEFKLQLNRQNRTDMDSCIDSRVVQTIN